MAATAEVVRRVVNTGEIDDVLAISDAKDIPYKMVSLPLYYDEPAVVTLWAKADSAMRIRVNALGKISSADLTTEWSRIEFKNENPDSKVFSITALGDATYYIYKGMIESGTTIASDWTEAVESLESTIDDVRTWFTFRQDGLRTRKMTVDPDTGEVTPASKWSTYIDNEGFYIDHDDVLGHVGAFFREQAIFRSLQVTKTAQDEMNTAIRVRPTSKGGWVWTD